jgi:hypothetical protein
MDHDVGSTLTFTNTCFSGNQNNEDLTRVHHETDEQLKLTVRHILVQ